MRLVRQVHHAAVEVHRSAAVVTLSVEEAIGASLLAARRAMQRQQ